jgi:hypothetical protein
MSEEDAVGFLEQTPQDTEFDGWKMYLVASSPDTPCRNVHLDTPTRQPRGSLPLADAIGIVVSKPPKNVDGNEV